MIDKLRKDKTTRQAWIKKLDKLVSEIVILRDKECVLCGSKKQLGCGHLLTRGAYATRWDLVNCNCQCWAHNYYHERHPEKYTQWFLWRYGMNQYDHLIKKHHTITHFKAFDLKELYEELKKMRDAYLKGKSEKEMRCLEEERV